MKWAPLQRITGTDLLYIISRTINERLLISNYIQKKQQTFSKIGYFLTI